MKRKILDFSVMKEEISQNNVLEMAELIAFMEVIREIMHKKCIPTCTPISSTKTN